MATPPKPRVGKNIRALLEMSVRDDLIITPPLLEFLSKWDGDMSEKAARAIYKAISERSRDRSASFSASGAGKCLRRQELQFLGMPSIGSPDARLRVIFLNGTWTHLRWQGTLLTAGLLDSIESTFKKKSQRARCSMDGAGTATVGRYKGAEFGFELKGRNDFQFNKQIAKGIDEETQAQVDFSLLITGLDLWVVMNENKNTQDMKEWVVVREDWRINKMALQLQELNDAIDNQILHPMIPECQKQLKNGEFYECPYGGKGGSCISSGEFPGSRKK